MEKPGGLWIPKKCNKESSWEELAFAEDDAAGSMWPPRSYTCSFCRREFRSAQALGGHMNVHRRDRARLKQSDDQYLFSKSSSSPEYPSKENDDNIRETSCYTLVFNSRPNSFKSHQHSCVIDLSSSSSSSLPRNQDTSPSFAIEPAKTSRKILCNSPWSYPSTFVDQKHEIPVMEGDKKRKIDREIGKLNLRNSTDLSVSMNLVIHQSFPIGRDEENGRVDICKRRRRRHEISPSQPSIFVSSLSCKGDIITRSEEIKEKSDRFEELDLELRLGTHPPKGN